MLQAQVPKEADLMPTAPEREPRGDTMTSHFRRIDHLAIAVANLEAAVAFYVGMLGMTMIERRETRGKHTGMLSAVLDAGAFKIVLMEGVGEQSQVSRFVENFGQGVQHVAFEVDDVARTAESLAQAGMQFSTKLLAGPGLKQIFSTRDPVSGMMYELIERTGETGFQDDNVNQLFQQLEESGSY
jgi:methylmalonyl-CoA/ethylmalonyl-CoA epimerase